MRAPEGSPATVAVLWHRSTMGVTQIIGVFEKPSDAKAMLKTANDQLLLQAGVYSVTVRPLTRGIPEPHEAPWP